MAIFIPRFSESCSSIRLISALCALFFLPGFLPAVSRGYSVVPGLSEIWEDLSYPCPESKTVFLVQYVFLFFLPSIQKINTVETNVSSDFTWKLPKIAFGSTIFLSKWLSSFVCVFLKHSIYGYHRQGKRTLIVNRITGQGQHHRNMHSCG